MKQRSRHMRFLSALLAMIMVVSMFPTSALAVGETIRGELTTITVGNNATSRDNNFNKGWKFNLGNNSTAQNPNFDDSAWTTVNLPHDFSITQAFTSSSEGESGFLPGGTGWYRKTFTLGQENEGKRIVLRFDGVYSDASVYVNDTKVGEHHYGYSTFAFDITDHLICDGTTENVIAVKAVNNIPTSRWYSGSGIYRDVTLTVTDPIHVNLFGTQVTTPDIASGLGTVHTAVEVVNETGAAASVQVTNTVYAKGSDTALATGESTVTVGVGSTVTAENDATVSNPQLWSLENPNLYVVKTQLQVNGEVVDTYETEFGFRWTSFDSQGFHLNGQNVKLNGVCLHHDQGGLGSAAYYDAMYRQLSIMKDMGCNAIRTSHNPTDEDFISICNTLGFLVMEEAFDGLVDPKNGNSNDFSRYFESSVDTNLYGASNGMTCAEYAARSMIRRDRNAPAIIAWSFGNEIQEGTNKTNASRYDDICANFIRWMKDEDDTRPVTSGDNSRGNDSRLVDVVRTITNSGGIAGFNYPNSTSTMRSLVNNYNGGRGCIIASETSSATNSRSIYVSQSNNSNADRKYHLTSYDTSAVIWGTTAHNAIYNAYNLDTVAGEFVWTGFDYIGEPTPWNGVSAGDSGRGAIPNSSYFGIVDTAGFEKDTYYLYRSQWNKNATTLHLVTAWDSDNMMTTSGKTPVWVYSNAPVVKLYRNGTLVGTATRQDHTSAAGHTYYTYTTKSENSICTTSSGSGSTALYSVFNVTYASGTLSARAFESDGVTEIALTGNSGKNTVSTPGSVSKLIVSQNKTVAQADGTSLVYISVDVTDANGNLDTTATNNIRFTLSGNGQIVAVDNGDQATVNKYQQRSVLTSTTSANINAYAGKALVIVRTTEEAGSFTVNVASNGLTGGSATVTTTEVSGSQTDGLTSFTLVRDYTIMAGTVPTLDTTVIGTMGNGSTVSGTITWEPVTAEQYNTAGDHTIAGVVTFPGEEPIPVTARLHVVANVVALRNVSTVTMTGIVPTLPDTVKGVLADGTLSGEFQVTWQLPSASAFAHTGDVVVVSGTAVIFGSTTMDVTCAVRVAEAVNTESTNVAPMADSLSQDIASGYQSDRLASIINGVKKPGNNTNERWTNWRNRRNSATATLTLTWATAQMLSGVEFYYYIDNCSNVAESVAFEYSMNGMDFETIGASSTLVESYDLGAQYSHVFEKPINPVALRITLTQQGGTSGTHCVGLTELEVMTFTASVGINTSADLSGIIVDGVALEGFDTNTLSYTAAGSTVAATGADNAAVTILPVNGNVVQILTLSEDGSLSKTYSVTLDAACDHSHTEIRNAVEATCTTAGYTGDTYCINCGIQLEVGTTIPALTHQFGNWELTLGQTCTEEGLETRTCELCGETEEQIVPASRHLHRIVRNSFNATCTTSGYTGDTYCADCGELLEEGTVINAYEHIWNTGVVTQKPQDGVNGIRTYTCLLCGETRTEVIIAQPERKIPKVTLTVGKNTSTERIVMTGKVEDFEHLDEYYEISEHGFVYTYTSTLGTRMLTVSTPGRKQVNFSDYKDDGSFIYNLKPSSKTLSYTIRAFVSYVNPETGIKYYVYSDPVSSYYYRLPTLK